MRVFGGELHLHEDGELPCLRVEQVNGLREGLCDEVFGPPPRLHFLVEVSRPITLEIHGLRTLAWKFVEVCSDDLQPAQRRREHPLTLHKRLSTTYKLHALLHGLCPLPFPHE
jgi:hypothetical protein